MEALWKVVYRDCQPTPNYPAGAAAWPAPQGWYAQAQQPTPSQTQAQTQAQTQTQAPAQAQAPAPAPPGHASAVACTDTGPGTVPVVPRGGPPPSPVPSQARTGGGSVPWVARACTQRTARAAPMTRLDPPRTHVFGVAATTGPWAARARRRLPRPPRPFRPGRPQRRPAAEEPGASARDGPASDGGADDEGGGALDLRYAGSAVDSLWWGNYMEEPLALAIRRWSPGTVERWTAILRDVGRFAAHWPELDAAGALSQYLVRRAAMGQQPRTLRGVISALRLAEKLGCIRPTVRPVHWLMARGAATTTAAPRPTQVWAELVTLRLMARSIRTTLDWFCLGLAVISFATLLRLGEAASVRPVDLRKRCVLGFFDDKKDDDWVTVRLGAWPEAWRAAMAAHPWVSSRPVSVPLMAAAFDLQAAIHGLLAATWWESMGWHAWRRGGAAAMRAFGAAVASIAVAGRWDNEAEAHRYASAPPGWEFFLPDNVPWPTPGFGVEIRPVHAYQPWALGTLGPRGPDGTGAAPAPPDVRAGNHGGQGTGLRGDSDMQETIVLGSSSDESPGTVARRAARHPREGQRKAYVHRAVARGRSAPAARATRAEPAPKPRAKQAADGAADRRAAAPRSAAVPRVTPARASTRGTQAPGGAPARRRSGAAGDAAGGCTVRQVRPRLERPPRGGGAPHGAQPEGPC